MPHGKGINKFDDSSKYEGEFVNGKPQGRGKFTNDLLCYEGIFQEGMFHGEGMIFYKSG
jgi:hypothetical protein